MANAAPGLSRSYIRLINSAAAGLVVKMAQKASQPPSSIAASRSPCALPVSGRPISCGDSIYATGPRIRAQDQGQDAKQTDQPQSTLAAHGPARKVRLALIQG